MNEAVFESNSMLIYSPRFIDESHQRIRAIARLSDGRILELEGDRSETKSDFIRDIFLQYTEDEIAKCTAREKRRIELKQKVDEQSERDHQTLEENEITFQAKAKALALHEVQNCTDKRVIRKIRKSKSAFEVAGWLAVAFMKSLEMEDQKTTQVV